MSPRPVADQPRKTTVCFRTTDPERREIEAWVGDRNRSDLLRRLVLDHIRSNKK